MPALPERLNMRLRPIPSGILGRNCCLVAHSPARKWRVRINCRLALCFRHLRPKPLVLASWSSLFIYLVRLCKSLFFGILQALFPSCKRYLSKPYFDVKEWGVALKKRPIGHFPVLIANGQFLGSYLAVAAFQFTQCSHISCYWMPCTYHSTMNLCDSAHCVIIVHTFQKQMFECPSLFHDHAIVVVDVLPDVSVILTILPALLPVGHWTESLPRSAHLSCL